MATNIGNPAFRMALRGLLVRELLGAVPRDPLAATPQGGDIFLSQNAPKKPSIFETKFRSFDASACLPPLSAVVPRGGH